MPNVLRHIKPCRILDVDGVFFSYLVVNMRISRIGLGMALASMGMIVVSDGLNRSTDSLGALSRTMRLTQPAKHKSKPNRISQAKRRKYKRQGRG